MSTHDFTPTAFTVRSPGNGQQRRYDLNSPSAEWGRESFARLAADWPGLAAGVVPDHYVQSYCRAADSASWSGLSGVSSAAEMAVFLDLLEVAGRAARFN